MKKHAVLIGVNEYQFLGKLDFTRQDAEAVAQALKENYGFADDEITLMTCGEDLTPLDRDAVTDILTPECVCGAFVVLPYGNAYGVPCGRDVRDPSDARAVNEA